MALLTLVSWINSSGVGGLCVLLDLYGAVHFITPPEPQTLMTTSACTPKSTTSADVTSLCSNPVTALVRGSADGPSFLMYRGSRLDYNSDSA